MSVLPVLQFPDERLRKKAVAVKSVNDDIRLIVDNMLETMYAEEGIGLAATQVNIHQRILVIDISDDRTQPQVFINPELIEKSGDTAIEEGCLSVCDYRALVPRAENIRLKALDRHGTEFEITASGAGGDGSPHARR